MSNSKSILFICLGNICRSPAAQAVMEQMAGNGSRIGIDSAGIGPWHVGQLPDRRMRKAGSRRGYNINHVARQFDSATDFSRFDYIVVMDEDNYRNISRQAHNAEERGKIVRMADYFEKYKGRTSVPDPYYGSEEDFNLALDLIEDGCSGLLKHLLQA